MNKNIFFRDLSFTYILAESGEDIVAFRETITSRVYLIIVGWTPAAVVFPLASGDDANLWYKTLVVMFGMTSTLFALMRGSIIFNNRAETVTLNNGRRKIFGKKVVKYEDVRNVLVRFHSYSSLYTGFQSLYYFSVHLMVRDMNELLLFKGESEAIVNEYMRELVRNNSLKIAHDTTGS